MSRTFRCKNYEAETGGSWSRQGRKIAGYYTIKELVCVAIRFEYHKTAVVRTLYVYERPFRAPTQEEFNKQYHKIHGESSSANSRSPSRSYRNNRHIQRRMRDKQELCRYIKNPDTCELVFYDALSCMWDWD